MITKCGEICATASTAHQARCLNLATHHLWYMVFQVLEVLSDVTLNLDNSRNTGKDINIQTVLSLEQLTLTTGKLVLIFFMQTVCTLSHTNLAKYHKSQNDKKCDSASENRSYVSQIYFEILYLWHRHRLTSTPALAPGAGTSLGSLTCSSGCELVRVRVRVDQWGAGWLGDTDALLLYLGDTHL